MIKKIENILKQGGIEEYKAEAKLIVLELSGMKLEEIMLKKEIPNQDKMIEFNKCI